MSVLIAGLILLAIGITLSLHRDRKKPAGQFDPDAPTIDCGPLEDSFGMVAGEPAKPMEAALLGGAFKQGQWAANKLIEAVQNNHFTLRPNWDEAPEWAMWAAQDEDGEVDFFKVRPVEKDGPRLWNSRADDDGEHIYVFWRRGKSNPNWKQAIEQRPVKSRPVDRLIETEQDPERRLLLVEARDWLDANKEGLIASSVVTDITPERDNCDLISREELAHLRATEAAYNVLRESCIDHAALLKAARNHCLYPGNVRKFKRLAKLAGVEL